MEILVKKDGLDYSLVFFSSSLIPSTGVLHQYCRIPDVLARVVKAKVILQKNKLSVPLWMYGLSDKKENNLVQCRLASFLVTLGLYDRLVRFHGVPDFLMGSSLAVSVAARMKTFERSIIRILMGMHYDSQAIRVYKKKPDPSLQGMQKSARFSLLSFFKSVNHKLILQSLKQECPSANGLIISIHPSKSDIHSMRFGSSKSDFSFKNFIDVDLQLKWLRPALRRSQIRKKHISMKPFIEENFI